MTNEEAIIVLALLLQKLKLIRADGKSTTHTLQTMALDMAIQALEQQPCKDCISREAVLMEIDKYMCGVPFDEKDIYEVIKELPLVTPKPKIGKWIILDECANEGVYCSECHKKVFKLEYSHTMKWRNFKYCPNCGADMRGEAE